MRKPQVFLFKGHTDTVNTILLDASSSCIVSGGRDQSVRIWDIRTGRQRSSMMEHFGSVNCLAISKDKNGSYLSSGRDGVICIWKRVSGEFTKSLRQGPNAKAVGCLAVKAGEGSDGGSRSVCGSSDGMIRVWDHARGKCLRVLGGSQGSGTAAITEACWSAAPGHVLSGGTDGRVRLWDCRQGRCKQYIQAHSGAVTSMLAVGGGVVSSGRDGALRIWNPGMR
jgi:WD40 repeat protein